MRYFVLLIFIVSSILFSTPLKAQVTAVTDVEHTQTSTVEATVETASTALKQFFEKPWIEQISKVQTFLKDASQIVSAIVKNLRMTRQLIQAETDIYNLFVRYLALLDESESFAEKWKYRWILTQLFQENLKNFEVFDLATQQNRGIIDDKGRIKLIKDTLHRTNKIKAAMRSTIARANRAWYRLKRQEKEIKTFKELFKRN